MNHLWLQDIQPDLAEVISSLHYGEIVQIVVGDKVVAHLIGEGKNLSRNRQPGSAVGRLEIVAEDDEHLTDFIDYMV